MSEPRYDEDKVAEMVLALLYLNTWQERKRPFEVYRAWKGFPWDALDRLYEKGYIANPRSRAKSVVVTEEGVNKSRELFYRYFGLPENSDDT